MIPFPIYKDDCGTVHPLTQRSLYEDEAGCNHSQGVDCLYSWKEQQQEGVELLTTTIWVPPSMTCQNTGICDEGEDKLGPALCKVALVCERGTEEREVYETQMCDETIDHDGYCDDPLLTFINCPGERPNDITCLRGGGSVTVAPRLLCDGEEVCDGGEDEQCFLVPGSRGTSNCSEICENSPCTLHASAVGACVTETTEFLACPGNSSYHLDTSMLCDMITQCDDDSEEERCPWKLAIEEKYRPLNETEARYLNATHSSNAYIDSECEDGIFDHDKCHQRYFYTIAESVCDLEAFTCEEGYVQGNCIVEYPKGTIMCEQKATDSYGEMEIETANYMNTIHLNENVVPLNNLTIFTLKDTVIEEGYRRCDQAIQSSPLIEFLRWCDTIEDCVGGLDEVACSSDQTFNCEMKKPGYKQYIYDSQVCDDVTDCPNSADECNDDARCSNDETRNIIKGSYRPVAGIIGVTALIINTVSIINYFVQMNKGISANSYINQTFVGLISLGDLLIGLYMILTLAATLSFGDQYCPERWKWLSSWKCSALGVLSTTGTMLSMLSMTALSVFRMHSLKSMIRLGTMNWKKKLLLWSFCLSVFVVSLMIGVAPLLKADYFVNGLFLETSPIFPDLVTRTDIDTTIGYYGNASVASSSWTSYVKSMGDLYLHDLEIVQTYPSSFKGETVGFYGNQGVCLFKYFVRSEDPQVAYSLTILGLSCTCFIIMTICYIFIFLYATASSRGAGATEVQHRSMVRLQRKVSLIIITDFMTWIPFIIIALLHYAETIDGSKYYDVSSILLIPINSVVNPIIYNGDSFIDFIRGLWKSYGKDTTSSSKKTVVSSL